MGKAKRAFREDFVSKALLFCVGINQYLTAFDTRTRRDACVINCITFLLLRNVIKIDSTSTTLWSLMIHTQKHTTRKKLGKQHPSKFCYTSSNAA